MRVAISPDGVDIDCGPARHLRLWHPSEAVPEALKAPADRVPTLVDGKRNGITVPDGARWVWLRFASDEPDLEGEIIDIDTLRRFAVYTVREAGWLDRNHWSRPARFPASWLTHGRTPTDFQLGKITDLRFAVQGQAMVAFAEAFLWPAGVNAEADRMWQRLQMTPEAVHCSVGGPPIGAPREEVLSDGRTVRRAYVLMNHIALCDQAVNPHGTEVRTVPFGEFAKAIADGIACDWLPEAAKAVTASGSGGLQAQGREPQCLDCDVSTFRERLRRRFPAGGFKD
ncbi:MAG: hypothetical protein KC620_22035, partial [Myxococcales bacterium]|nr:hypothetical protein [Myxococcales bacterium]